MRVARKKLTKTGCYYHLMNRVAGEEHSYPLGDVDREYGMKLVKRLSEYYLLEFISMCWMGNHFHIVLYAPPVSELTSDEEIAARHNAFYGERHPRNIDASDSAACAKTGADMVDISRFMKDFQQRYVFYFNKTHRRRGHFWADRFKSTILEGRQALWTAVKYVELNPVRAGLAAEPADYRHCTWGWMSGSGAHPFGDSFFKHMRRSLGESAAGMTREELHALFRSELARTIANESSLDEEETRAKMRKAERGETMPVRFLRRTRHWTDGGIIGSKSFVRDVALKLGDGAKRAGKRFSRGAVDDGHLYCYKVLRASV